MDIRYMWSDIDSEEGIEKRRQPSRGVVFRRSRMWKKGMGVVGLAGGGKGRVVRTIVFRSGTVCFGRRIRDHLHVERRRRVDVEEGGRSLPC